MSSYPVMVELEQMPELLLDAGRFRRQETRKMRQTLVNILITDEAPVLERVSPALAVDLGRRYTSSICAISALTDSGVSGLGLVVSICWRTSFQNWLNSDSSAVDA